MSSNLQTFLALGVVAVAALALVARWQRKRRTPGCGGDCGCASSQIKARVRELDV